MDDASTTGLRSRSLLFLRCSTRLIALLVLPNGAAAAKKAGAASKRSAKAVDEHQHVSLQRNSVGHTDEASDNEEARRRIEKLIAEVDVDIQKQKVGSKQRKKILEFEITQLNRRRALLRLAGREAHVCSSTDSSYATFVSGDRYVPGAMCLRESLRAVSNCPMDVIYDDRTARLMLSPWALNALNQSLTSGVDRLFPLSALMAAHPASAREMNYSVPKRAGTKKQLAHFAATGGRRLFERGMGTFLTHAKLWYWALPRARVVALDSDMVVVDGLDWLHTLPLEPPEQIAAVPLAYTVPGVGEGATFNSGVMVLEPSSAGLRNLTRLASGGSSIVVHKMGERLLGDQSILNTNFVGRWQRLPLNLTRPISGRNVLKADRQSVLERGSAVLHWLSEPKPWGNDLKATLEMTCQLAKGGTQKGTHLRSNEDIWWHFCLKRVRRTLRPHRCSL
jgi:hypothetical protein